VKLSVRWRWLPDRVPDEALPPFRRRALRAWPDASAASFFVDREVFLDATLERIERIERDQARVSGSSASERTSLTARFVAAAARAIHEVPELNRIRVRGSYAQREHVNVQVMLHIPTATAGDDLGRCLVREAERKSPQEIQRELSARRDVLLTTPPPPATWQERLPAFAFRWVAEARLMLGVDLGLRAQGFSIERDDVPSLSISNVGSIGIDRAAATLVPWSRSAVAGYLGAVQRAPRPGPSGELLPRWFMDFTLVIDHRIADGIHAGRFFAALQRTLDRDAAEDATGPEPLARQR
jgi:pyruvate/2-oxoglutarate dehydrogenase complex dihydrolipoamide acyltransferase (E2) component